MRFDEEKALLYIFQIASALEFVHQLGIGHRDISLENIFVHDGECKLGDFGLSTSQKIISNDQMVGKFYYMAPEIVRGDAYDPKAADMWSLGILLFIMLTGVPAVNIASSKDVHYSMLRFHGVKGLLRLLSMEDSISNDTINLLSRLLCIAPKDRIKISDAVGHPCFDQQHMEMLVL